MKYLFVIICIQILSLTYIYTQDIYELENQELYLKSLLAEDSTQRRLATRINRIRNNIKDIKERLGDLENITTIRQECKKTYRCSGEEYVSGCPCWTYTIAENETHQIFNFNKFHPDGLLETEDVKPEENILKACDSTQPPWSWVHIYNGNQRSYGVLVKFAHCVHNGVVDCYCSSLRKRQLPDLVSEYHCSNEKLKPEDKCWEFEIDNETSNENTTIFTTQWKQALNFGKNTKGVVEEKLIEVCGDYKDSYLQEFIHCTRGTHWFCFCKILLKRRTGLVAGCGVAQALAGGLCARMA